MSKGQKTKSQTSPKVVYKPKARGPYQHGSIVYVPMKPKKEAEPELLPDPRSGFYARIMAAYWASKQVKKSK